MKLVSLSEDRTRSLISCENGVLAYDSQAQWYGSTMHLIKLETATHNQNTAEN